MTTRDEVIKAAKGVGFCIAEAAYPYTVKPVASAEQLDRFYAIAYKAGMERAAEIAATTVCDKHIPTGVSIYGSRAARAIREEAKK